MADDKKITVRTPSEAHNEMIAAAQLPRTLMGGTSAMRAACKEYLPQEPKEETTAYNIRVARSFLFNKYGMTVDEMVGRLFSNGMKTDGVPAEIEALFGNIDLTGRDLVRFTRDLFESALQPGVDYLLVDYPPAPEPTDGSEETRQLSKAEEAALGLRPFWVHIKQENVLKWRTTVVNGVETLDRVQILEIVEEPDGEWGSKTVEQVRVLTPGAWETHRVGDDGEWRVHKHGVTTIDFIPLVPVHTCRTGCMTGKPPLMKLAELNLCHFQSSSDQRNILHVARVPIMFGAGFDESTGTIAVGVNTMITNSNPDAKLTFVEHTGKAIEAGTHDLEQLEAQMKLAALEPLVPKTGNVTATAKAIDATQESALLQTMGEDLGDCLELAISYTLRWLGKDGKSTGSIEFECDMSAEFGQQPDLDALDKARARKDISRPAFLKELQRRKVLGEEFDIEKDQALLDEEGPSLSELMPPTPKEQ